MVVVGVCAGLKQQLCARDGIARCIFTQSRDTFRFSGVDVESSVQLSPNLISKVEKSSDLNGKAILDWATV